MPFVRNRPYVDTKYKSCHYMVYMDTQTLIKIRKKSVLTKEEMLSSGVTLYRLKEWIKSGHVKRVSHGIYRLLLEYSDDEFHDERFREATAIAGSKSAVCLLSALEYYHLTDLITESVWVMVPHNKRVQSEKLTILRTRNPHWTIGILRQRGFKITSLERTLIDCLIQQRKIARTVAIEAIKMALKDRKTDLNVLYETAKKLGVERRLSHILEVLM